MTDISKNPSEYMTSWRTSDLESSSRETLDLPARLLRSLPAIAAGNRIAWPAVLQDAGLAAGATGDATPQYDAAMMERLFLACAKRLQCDHLGLDIGAPTLLNDLAPGCSEARCVASTRAGLQVLIEHFNLHDRVGMLELVESTTEAKIRFRVCEYGLQQPDQLALLGIAAVHGALRELLGEDWTPTVTRLACPAPASTDPFAAHFRSPLEFDAAETALVIDGARLQQSLPYLDPRQHAAYSADGARHWTAALADLKTTLRRLLRKRLALGPESIAMEVVSAQLRMHRRTLDRRLERFGSTFGAELEAVRSEVARRLLTQTTLPVHQIADAVCFSSAANFATAFRRQNGMTPTEYRRSVT